MCLVEFLEREQLLPDERRDGPIRSPTISSGIALPWPDARADAGRNVIRAGRDRRCLASAAIADQS
jgi:hypothetical protein